MKLFLSLMQPTSLCRSVSCRESRGFPSLAPAVLGRLSLWDPLGKGAQAKRRTAAPRLLSQRQQRYELLEPTLDWLDLLD